MLKLSIFSALSGATVTALFGSSPFLPALLIMIALDIITGFIKGIYCKELRSRKMYHGMLRKLMIFVVIIMANCIDIVMFGGLPVTSSAVVTFYIAMEGISITENLIAMDVPVPKWLRKHLEIMKDKGNNLELKDKDKK